jgi:RNA recognition motif. (a.k.a. RRM, RBD, or RNP domain)
MVETVENRMAATASPSTIRIFMGGLGENVAAVDIENTFASLGRVQNVELVRTNGRSFGYMDFEPQSDKALAKLFSTVSTLWSSYLFYSFFFLIESIWIAKSDKSHEFAD